MYVRSRTCWTWKSTCCSSTRPTTSSWRTRRGGPELARQRACGGDATRKDRRVPHHGKSKDSRDDLPQIVIGMAVTRQAIPVRVWCWPGNTADSALIGRSGTTCGTGPSVRSSGSPTAGSPPPGTATTCSAAPAGTIGEKLRSESPHVKAALSRQGRYQQVAGNLQVKEVRISDRPVRDLPQPDAAVRDAAIRDKLVAQLEQTIAGPISSAPPSGPNCAGRSP